jgi:dihydrofolate reductase
MPRIVLIAAASENNIIGKDGGLPWRLPDDLKHFKRETIGRPVIMGRKTFDELFGKPLPDRVNIIVSRTLKETPGAIVKPSLEEAIEYAGSLLAESLSAQQQTPAQPAPPPEICIIGGGEIYRQSLPIATHITLTRVHAQVEGDTTFPDFDKSEWRLDRSERHEPDARHAHAFTIEWWSRPSRPR